MLDKTFRPQDVEQRLYDSWEQTGAFACGQRGNAQPYTIVIPPPNVTGSLHMGHALNNTLQDIVIRRQRMAGRDVLWQPGSDHAGIATQMVVERNLEAEGKKRTDMSREAFVDKVWAWKEESGGVITNQLRRLGASCDWRRERFTMDDGLSHAVRKVFVDLYRDGLIYKDKRLVNWDPKLRTAISDLEVQPTEVKGHLWHFKYPIEGENGRFIVVATTRPETMLGDTAVAVHPDDERYKDLVGRHAVLPLVGRRIRIVADDYADPEQGSGAVKITPAHDFNDFEVGRRHDLEMINIFTDTAHLNDEVPEPYRRLERFEARKRIVADLEALDLVEQIEDYVHTVPYGDRGGVPIEPYLTEQWYADAATLAKPAIEAVETGKTRIVPEQWTKTYFDWMRNIQPWCISRQLWWGHQIPAWYGPDEKIFVATTEAEAQAAADAHYGKPTELRRDPDVLDTWFSSGLWPFSTLGWPEQTPELERYYPTDLLVTGFDILFFWVARMMMFGLRFMGEVPFHTVYIHGIVRDEKGAKMSKSKGNVVDPLDLMDEFGADALRFTMAALATPGRDVKPARARIEGYRNFATKLWNAARFAEMNECVAPPSRPQPTLTLNRWIVGALARTASDVARGIDEYRFDEAAAAVYHFVWGTYCDWYLELIKPVLQGPDGAEKDETRATAAWVLEQMMHLLHPFMPFVTEELWQRTGTRTEMLALSQWPDFEAEVRDPAAEAEIEWLIKLVSEVRSVRNELRVPASAKIEAYLEDANDVSASRLATHRQVIQRLARIQFPEGAADSPPGAVHVPLEEATVALALLDTIDLQAERSRLGKELDKLTADVKRMNAKLANENFVSRAPEEVVEGQREQLAEAEQRRVQLSDALAQLGGAA
ncbi:MAG: valine--tRNA ligase [Alphaproteobacteria bacterium]